MQQYRLDYHPAKMLKDFSITVVFCTLIALFLVAIDVAKPLSTVLVMSYSIGFCIHLFIAAGFWVIKPGATVTILLIIIFGAVAGNVAGIRLGPVLSELLLNQPVDFTNPSVFKIAIFGFSFGAVISFFFWSRHSLSATQARVQEETIKRIRSENAAIKANLRLLQAQIEPHFLFNTLSTIHSLMDTEPETAKAMLLDLNQYLRQSLRQTREEASTLGREMEVIAAYLNIFKIRMGERLQFSMDLPPSLKSASFPPMLLQPLVENAVIHGIEPAEAGGRIDVRVQKRQALLRVEIADTGIGFTAESGEGVGLANVRQRLGLIFGTNAHLAINANHPHGVKVVIEINDADAD